MHSLFKTLCIVKKIVLLSLFAILLCGTSTAQNSAYEYLPVWKVDTLDVSPMFPNGKAGLAEYFRNHLIYPRKAYRKGIEGRVICKFEIDTVGKVCNVTVLDSVHPLLDEEAVRVVEAMPLWKPGEQRERKVITKFVIPINFRK